MPSLTQVLLVAACLVAVQSWPAIISPDVSPDVSRDKDRHHDSFALASPESGHKDEAQGKPDAARDQSLPHPWEITDAFEKLADQIRHQDSAEEPHQPSTDQAHVRYFQRIA